MMREVGLPAKSITTDNGSEFAAHQVIAKELNTTVFFAHPYSSWEKGAIENMNGLIRQYVPKKQILRGFQTRIYNTLWTNLTTDQERKTILRHLMI